MVHDWNDGGYGWWWLIPMMAFMVGFGVAVIVILARATHPEDAGERSVRPANPEDVLAQRFATGEIDAAEYKERVETLRLTRR